MNRRSRQLHRPWVSPPTAQDAYAAWWKRSKEPDFEAVLVWQPKRKEVVGVFNISQIFHGGFCSAYLSYYGNTAFTSQGLMGEALQLVLAHSFTTLKLHRLEANIQPENVASIKLVKQGGFLMEGFSPKYLKIGGRWRDHERWAILKEYWLDGKQKRK